MIAFANRKKREFEDCVEHTFAGGIHTYSCRKGLWSVSNSSQNAALAEAIHYFAQYEADGEYDDLP